MHMTVLTDQESPGTYIFAWKIYRIIGIGQDSRARLDAKMYLRGCKFFSMQKYAKGER